MFLHVTLIKPTADDFAWPQCCLFMPHKYSLQNTHFSKTHLNAPVRNYESGCVTVAVSSNTKFYTALIRPQNVRKLGIMQWVRNMDHNNFSSVLQHGAVECTENKCTYWKKPQHCAHSCYVILRRITAG